LVVQAHVWGHQPSIGGMGVRPDGLTWRKDTAAQAPGLIPPPAPRDGLLPA